MSERVSRRFSQAISEGDAISVLVEVGDPTAARDAEAQGADGVVVRAGTGTVRDATELPILWWSRRADEARDAGADACLFVFSEFGDGAELGEQHVRARELGLDCVVEVRDEDELEEALERVDPEIFLLAGASDDDADPLDHVLALLPDVPAGKLAIAHLERAGREDVESLERAGMDAVVVGAQDVSSLVGAEPPEV